MIEVTWQSLITGGAVLGAATALIAFFAKIVRWVDRQKAQDMELENIKAKHESDAEAVQQELSMLTYGVLACLKGLREQGCNGPVTEAVNKIEKYLNMRAHEEKHRCN